MKTKLSTRFLSLLLCIVMCIGLMPSEAFADEGETEAKGTENAELLIENADIVNFDDAQEEQTEETHEESPVQEQEPSVSGEDMAEEVEDDPASTDGIIQTGTNSEPENEVEDQQNFTLISVKKVQPETRLELYQFPMEEGAEPIEPVQESEEENSYQILPGYYYLIASCDGYENREMNIYVSGKKDNLVILLDMTDTAGETGAEDETKEKTGEETVTNGEAYTALDPFILEVGKTKAIGIGSSCFSYSRRHKTAWYVTQGNVSLKNTSLQQCTVVGEFVGTDTVRCAIYSEYWRFDPRYCCLVFADSQYSVTSWNFKVTQPGYEIKYDANGGSGAPDTVFKQEGKTLYLSNKAPYRDGYTFLGWSTSSSATSASYKAGGAFTSDKDTTLYAVWKFDHYIISYSANGGSGAPGSQNKKAGESITLSSTVPTRTGCIFKGWSTSRNALTADYKAGATYSKDGNATLYAVWKHNPQTVRFDANGGTVSPESMFTQDNGCLAELPVPVKADYNFLGWYTALNGGTEVTTSYEIMEDITVYAHWKYDPPPAPPVLSVQNDCDWNIVLSWKAVSNAQKYHVFRAVKGEMVYREIASTSSCSYIDSDINEGSTYYYRVTAESPTNKISEPSTAQFAKKTFAAPTLSWKNSSTGLVVLMWEQLSDCCEYEVRKVTDGTYEYVTNVYTSSGSTGTYYCTLNINNEVYKDTVFVIRAVSTAGKESGYSNEVIASTKNITTVYKPRYVSDYHDENGKVVLEWESVANATEYQVLRKVDGDYSVIATTTDCTYTDRNAMAYKQYTYCICAVSVDGCISDKAGYVRAYAFSSAPPAEPELTLTVEENALHITSNEISGAKYYFLYRADRPDGEYSIVGGTTGQPLNFTDTNIVKGYTYFYKACVSVASSTKSDEEDFSNYGNLVYGGIGDLIPYAPAVMASAEHPGEIDLSWDQVIGAEYYVIYYGPQYMQKSILGSTSGCTYTFRDGNDSTSYSFQVRAVSASGILSEYSDNVTVEFKKATVVPEAPVVTVGHDSDGNIVLSWEPVANTIGYLIYGTDRADGSGTFSQFSVGDHGYNTFSETSVVLGTVATYYQVRAKTSDSKIYSCSDPVYAAGCKPTVEASQISSEEVKLSWDSVAGASAYQIIRSSNQEAVEEVCGETTSLEFTDNSVSCGVCYHYTVKAIFTDRSAETLDSVDVVTARGVQNLTAEIAPLYIGRAGKITVTGAHSDLSFKSSDSSVATVSADGLVYAVGIGVATITVSAAANAHYTYASTKVKVTVLLEDTVSGGCGTHLEWSLTQDGNLTISGTGVMINYSAKETPWYNYRSIIKSVTLEQGVTSLGEYAFYGCSALESITFPKSLIDIPSEYDAEVFSGCTAVSEIYVDPENPTWMSRGNCLIERATKELRLGSSNSVIPDDGTVISIASYAFQGKGISSIVIPTTITEIGKYAFAECKNLTEIDIPGSVEEIKDYVFYKCTGLKQATFHEGTKSIGRAFNGCTALETVVLPENMVEFGIYNGCSSLKTINIPDTITAIPAYAFQDCYCLEKINIPAGVVSIGEYAFSACRKLKTIDIPSGVTEIKEKTFYQCWNLTSLPLHNGVTSIGPSAFAYSGIKDLNLPATVTSIGNKAFAYVDVESVTLPSTVQTYGSNIFEWADKLKSIKFPANMKTVPVGICYKCTALTDVSLPSKLVSIGNQAFYGCSSLASVDLPATLQRIGEEAFYTCGALNVVTLPKGIISLGKNSLYTVDKVIFPGTKEAWALVDVASCAIRNTAVCTGTVYKITFDPMGGIGGPVTMTRYYGEFTYLPEETPTRSKYSFQGWKLYYDSGSYTTYSAGERIRDKDNDGDLKFYAYWGESSYKLQYLSLDGTVLGTQTVNYSQKATISYDGYSVPGYTVSGWEVSTGCDNNTYKGKTIKPGQNVTKLTCTDGGVVQLTPKLSPAKYTLVFHNDGSTSGSAPKRSVLTNATKYSVPKSGLKGTDTWCQKGWAFTAGEPTLHYSVVLPLSGAVTADQVKEFVAAAYAGGYVQDNSTIELYPVWGPVEYTITYKNIPTVKNFGETTNAASANNPALYNAVEGVEKLAEPVVPGYDFGGWYLDSKFKTPVSSIAVGSTGNKTIYAKLTAQSIGISYDLAGGTEGKKTPTAVLITKDTTLVNPTRTGYIFQGWYLDGVKVTKISKGTWYGNVINLVANWSPIAYNVSFNANGAKFIKGAATKVTAVYDTPVTLLGSDMMIAKAANYTLTGWNTKADGSGVTYTDADSVINLSAKNKATITLYAQWQYNVTIHNGLTGDAADAESLVLIFNNNHIVTSEGYENKGYTFMGWAISEANAVKGTVKYKAGAKIKNLTPGTELWAVWKRNAF